MSDESQVEPTKGEQPSTLSENQKEPDRELQRLKRALQRQQAEKAEAAAELERLKKQIEDEKLTVTERERKELEAARKQSEELARRVLEREAENERLRLVNRLVAKHKLEDEDYADIVLKHYNPKEHEDFDQFVSELAAQDKYKKFFVQPAAPAKPEPKAPAVPGSGNARDRTPTATAEEALQVEARAMFPGPNDAEKRRRYVENRLKLMKGGV